MAFKKLLPVAFAAATMFAVSAAGAATVVTLNPSGTNGALGAVDPGTSAFNTTGFAGVLDAALTINASSGVTNYSETGNILLNSFLNGNSIVGGTNLGSTYDIFATFSLSGSGSWMGTQFTADPGASLVFNLFADTDAGGNFEQDIQLGTGALDAAYPQVAFAIAFGSLAPNATGSALTSLTATVQFDPTAGTEGLGGFFEAPSPFAIDIALGNVGGNTLNTQYNVSAGGVVTMNTIGGSANGSFVQEVPEPSALALVGLGLAGLGLASRRKQRASA